jgi:hypothetical protein
LIKYLEEKKKTRCWLSPSVFKQIVFIDTKVFIITIFVFYSGRHAFQTFDTIFWLFNHNGTFLEDFAKATWEEDKYKNYMR